MQLDPLSRSRRLPAEIEIALAAGEIRRARETADELEAIADNYLVEGRRTPVFEGTVQLADGRIRLAEHDWAGAATALRAARDTWNKVGAPYETAQARMLLGLAYRGEGDEEGAKEELTLAKTTFERLGAVLDLQRASELLGESSTRRTFMFTDIVDSTKLVEVLGEAKWAKLLAWHDRTLRELIEEAGGEVIKQTGGRVLRGIPDAELRRSRQRPGSSALSTSTSRSRPTSASASTPAGRSTRTTPTTPAKASTSRRGSAPSPAGARSS